MNRGALLAVILAMMLAGCQPTPATGTAAPTVTAPPEPTLLTVMTHD
jgi:uncharacterized lipoprotein YajG